MYHLVYCSRATAAFSAEQLAALLAQARAFNQRHGLTGVLLYTLDRRFLQVLEGDKHAVRTLYHGHITADPRHAGCRVLSEGPWAQRNFPDWRMGFVTAGGFDAPTAPGRAQVRGLRQLLSLVAPAYPELGHLLQEFVRECDRVDQLAAPAERLTSECLPFHS